MKKSDSKRQAILKTAYGLFRAHGFEQTSMAEISALVGGSKATIYSYFQSKEELFVECVMAVLQDYMSETLKCLETADSEPGRALVKFGISVLRFICSTEQVEVRRMVIAEAVRSGTGRLFFDKLAELRGQVSAFLAGCMSAGTLRHDDPDLAADHLGALLEAEILEPLLLHVREDSPDELEIERAAERAIATFLRAYAPQDRPVAHPSNVEPAAMAGE